MRALRHWLLALLLLLAQAGALAHGLKHVPESFHGNEPACDLCLAFAPLGTGIASTPPAWSPPAIEASLHAVAPATSASGFQPPYRSRAPPRV